ALQSLPTARLAGGLDGHPVEREAVHGGALRRRRNRLVVPPHGLAPVRPGLGPPGPVPPRGGLDPLAAPPSPLHPAELRRGLLCPPRTRAARSPPVRDAALAGGLPLRGEGGGGPRRISALAASPAVAGGGPRDGGHPRALGCDTGVRAPRPPCRH